MEKQVSTKSLSKAVAALTDRLLSDIRVVVPPKHSDQTIQFPPVRIPIHKRGK